MWEVTHGYCRNFQTGIRSQFGIETAHKTRRGLRQWPPVCRRYFEKHFLMYFYAMQNKKWCNQHHVCIGSGMDLVSEM